MQQIERDCFSVAKLGPYIYTTLAFLALLGAPYIYAISSLRVNNVSSRNECYSVSRSVVVSGTQLSDGGV